MCHKIDKITRELGEVNTISIHVIRPFDGEYIKTAKRADITEK